MFSWFRRKKATAPPSPADLHADVLNESGQLNHDALLDLLARAMVESGREISRQDGYLVDLESRFAVKYDVHQLKPGEKGFNSTTTLTVMHPKLCPDGLYEYQHSWGDSANRAIYDGFDRWVRTDFTVLTDSLLLKPGRGMQIEMEFPEAAAGPARKRRVMLGPVEHLMTEPPKAADGCALSEKDEHPFCACCLLTRSMDAFRPLIEGTKYYGVRLYAARDRNGDPSADCRVNGEDFDPGKQGLIKYAETWKPAGVEFRKHYVVIQDSPVE